MHADRGQAERPGQAASEASTDQQRAGQPWSFGVGHRIHIGQWYAGLLQRAVQQWQQAADVIARGQLRHHAAIGVMQGHLRMQRMREQAALAVIERQAGFVARALYPED